MKRVLLFFTGIVALWQTGCMPFEEEKITEIEIDIRDSTYQKIYNFQDRHMTDSLYPYFHHRNPAYRYVAALAFASIQDTSALDSLATLLDDELDEIRAAAAYAIGQTGAATAEQSLIEAFDQTDTIGNSDKTNRAILEAIGKCGSPSYLEALSTVETYEPSDTALLEGQAWGIYRYALRNIIIPKGTARMVQLVSDRRYPQSVRFIAANYLMRAPDINLDTFTRQLIVATTEEKDARIRMALAIALGKTGSELAAEYLISQFKQDDDYRVRCNILRAFGNFDYERTQEVVLEALKDPNIHVASRAAQFFLDYGIAQDARMYWRTASDTLPWQVQLTLLQAANRYLPVYYTDYRNSINAQLRRRFRTATFPYEKAMALRALAEFAWNFRYIQREGFASGVPVIRTASAESLLAISQRKDFRSFFGSGYRRVSRELAAFFQQAIQSSDPAMIAVAAQALRIPERNFKNYLDSLNFLQNTLSNLDLPKEIETYNELKRTIDYFEEREDASPKTPGFNHPINWKMLSTFIEGTGRAEIHTSRGVITLALLPQKAPGSVANFVQLVRSEFYNGKNFHRVVPNFVIQGGCPRGDGYGSLDYTIRSELPPLHYNQAGFAGMASSGIHTEGTQFFITHSPTPHLDGKYTIFAKVTSGMDVVHKIQVGDTIQKIEIK